MAGGACSGCARTVVDSVWRPDTLTTASGATGLTDLLMCVLDPASVAERYGRYVRTRAGRARRGDMSSRSIAVRWCSSIRSKAARMLPDFGAPSVPFMAGQALRANLSKARALLKENGVSPVFENAAT